MVHAHLMTPYSRASFRSWPLLCFRFSTLVLDTLVHVVIGPNKDMNEADVKLKLKRET